MMEAGIARPGMIVARTLRRNRKITITTRMPAMTSVSSASLIERLMNMDWSYATDSVTPGGSSSFATGISARTASATSVMFACDCRTTPRPMPVRPLMRIRLRSFSGPSSTRARSRSFTSCPPWLLTTTLLNSSGVRSSPSARTVNSRRWLSMRPAGTSTLRAATACATSCTVSPRLASSRADSHTRME